MAIMLDILAAAIALLGAAGLLLSLGVLVRVFFKILTNIEKSDEDDVMTKFFPAMMGCGVFVLALIGGLVALGVIK